MNVRLKHQMVFNAGIWFDDRLQFNNYDVELHLTTATSDGDDHIVCLERIKHIIYDQLQDSVFIHQDDTKQIQALLAANVKVTTLPEIPIDQIVGLVIHNKLNAVLEERMFITATNISSELGESVQYLHSSNENTTGGVNGTGWWSDPSPSHTDAALQSGRKQVVKLTRKPSWRDLELDWTENSSNGSDSENTVVFGNFNKDEN